jgi:thiol-disulfide isomerase/thioredoxin/YHS domain-containing protein
MQAKNRLLWAAIGVLLLPSGVFAQQSQVWQPSLDAARRAAGQSNRLVLVFFCADWCMPCREMERDVFGQPNAIADLQTNYVLAKVNVNHFPATAKEYGITGVPTTVIITPQGQALATVPNRMGATPYVGKLTQIAANAKLAATAIAQGPPPTMPVPPPAVHAKNDDRYADRYADRGTDRYGETDAYANRPFVGPAPPPAGVAPASPLLTGPQFPAFPGPADNAGTPPGPSPESRVIPSPGLPSAPIMPPVGPVAATTPPAAPPATPSTTPPKTPAWGLDGFCPVCLVEQRKWVAGNRQYGIEHLGRVYLFERPEERDRFWANPELYSPVLAGNDAVISLERGQSIPGHREFGVFFGQRIYLFADKTSLEKFWKNPNQYANQALQATRAAAPFDPRQPMR